MCRPRTCRFLLELPALMHSMGHLVEPTSAGTHQYYCVNHLQVKPMTASRVLRLFEPSFCLM